MWLTTLVFPSLGLGPGASPSIFDGGGICNGLTVAGLLQAEFVLDWGLVTSRRYVLCGRTLCASSGPNVLKGGLRFSVSALLALLPGIASRWTSMER